MIGVVVPPLRFLWALTAVIADEYGQTDISAQKRPNRTRNGSIEEYVVDEPILEEDRTRGVGRPDALEVLVGHAFGDPRGIHLNLAFQVVARPTVNLVWHNPP